MAVKFYFCLAFVLFLMVLSSPESNAFANGAKHGSPGKKGFLEQKEKKVSTNYWFFNLDYSQYLTTQFLQQAHHVHQIYEKCVKESRKKNKKSDNSLPKCINFLIHHSFKISKTMNWSNDQTTRQNITNFKKGNNKGIIFGILVVSYKLCYNHLLFLSLPFSPQDDAENVLMKRRECEVARRMGC